jgi:uncharacterized protein (TIGR02145 family)
MKKFTCFILLLAFAYISISYGQRPAFELTFTGIKDTSYFQPGTIRVKNLTQGGDTTLYYPDTVLVLNYVGINEISDLPEGFTVLQNYPNPVTDKATIGICIPQRDNVNFTVTDILGRRLITSERTLEKGFHTFLFSPSGEELYFFTAYYRGTCQTIKILNSGQVPGKACTLEYSGYINDEMPLKSSSAVQEFPFSPGDRLLFIGTADTLESGFLDSPETSQEYVFQFATNIPCPGMDSIYYEGRWYHTIQIFSQCWLKENLDVGTMVTGTQAQTDNGIMEKYCYANLPVNCDKTGGLYLWEEMMQYSTLPGGRGICPEGWHLPADDEWKILEGVADSQYGIGSVIWNGTNFRGTDAGFNLKSTDGWSSDGDGADLYGFTAVAGGYWWQNSFFEYTNFGVYWTSSSNNSGLPYYRGLRMDMDQIARMLNTFGATGYSARCLKD